MMGVRNASQREASNRFRRRARAVNTKTRGLTSRFYERPSRHSLKSECHKTVDERMGMSETRRKSLETRMQHILGRLDIPLEVILCPESANENHGEVKSDFMFIYDSDPEEAWCTFQHEVNEYKFKEVAYLYNAFLNGLIDGFVKLIYERKEDFFDSLPRVDEVIAEEKKMEERTHHRTSTKRSTGDGAHGVYG